MSSGEEQHDLCVGDVVRVPLSVHRLVAAEQDGAAGGDKKKKENKKKKGKGADEEPAPPSTEQMHAIGVVRAVVEDEENKSDPKVRVDLGRGFRDAEAPPGAEDEDGQMIWFPLSQLAPVLVRGAMNGKGANDSPTTKESTKATVMNVEAKSATGDLSRAESKAVEEPSKAREAEEAQRATPTEEELKGAGLNDESDPGTVLDIAFFRIVAPVHSLLEWQFPFRCVAIIMLSILLLLVVDMSVVSSEGEGGHRVHTAKKDALLAEVALLDKDHQLLVSDFDTKRVHYNEQELLYEKKNEDLQKDNVHFATLLEKLEQREKTLMQKNEHLEKLMALEPSSKAAKKKLPVEQTKAKKAVVTARNAVEQAKLATEKLNSTIRDKNGELKEQNITLAKGRGKLDESKKFLDEQAAHLALRRAELAVSASLETSKGSNLFLLSIPFIRSLIWLTVFSTPGSRLASVTTATAGEHLFRRFYRKQRIALFGLLLTLVLATVALGIVSSSYSLGVTPLLLHIRPTMASLAIGDYVAVGISAVLVGVKMLGHTK